MVINMVVPREVILDRLTTRRTCSNSSCQSIYNVKTNPPNADGACKKCGSPTIQRDDETEEAILNRLEVYNEKTAPLINFYRKEGMVKDVTSLDLKEILAGITSALKKKRNSGSFCPDTLRIPLHYQWTPAHLPID
jgi:adenylate kinase